MSPEKKSPDKRSLRKKFLAKKSPGKKIPGEMNPGNGPGKKFGVKKGFRNNEPLENGLRTSVSHNLVYVRSWGEL